MKIFNLKTYFVFLSRNKMYTAINIGGLAVSLALVIIIGLYVQHETSLDLWQRNVNQIYVLGGRFGDGSTFEGSHWQIQKKLKSRYPEVQRTCTMYDSNGSTIANESGTKVRVCLSYADSTYLDMFDFPLEVGDRKHALEDKNCIMLTRKVANALFGNSNPIGKTVIIDRGDTLRLRVTAIMGEMRNTSLTPADAVVRFENVTNRSLLDDGLSNAVGASLFIQTKPGTDLQAKTKDMADYFKTFFWFYKTPDCAVDVILYPFNNLHFAKVNGGGSGVVNYGYKRLVNIMLAAGLAVLIFSLMNYINLTVAQGGFRAREMAMRRLLGSRRSQVVGRLIGESFCLCLISLIIALLLAAALLPSTDGLLDVDIRFADLLTPRNVSIIVAALVVFSVAAGVVPAIIISSAKPIDMVRGTFRQRTKMLFSKVFIVIQNVITIVMLAASLTMVLQVRHLVNAPLGYDTDRLMTFPSEARDSTQATTFMQELRKLPCVEQASVGYGLPLMRGNNNTTQVNGKTLSFQIFVEDTAFMNMLDLKLLRDLHTTSAPDVWWANVGNGKTFVNKKLLLDEGLDMNATSIWIGEKKIPIDGVIKDFQIGIITSEAHPVIVRIQNNIRDFWFFSLRYKGDPVMAYNTINELHRKIFDVDIDDTYPVFVDQNIARSFSDNIRTMRLVSVFTVVAIVISLLGLVAMSTYFIEQRKREIAVRRVFGGSTRDILARLVRTFMAYVLVAFVIAVPIIYWFMSDWLSDFSYRISLSPLIFIAAGAVSVLISFVAVFFQSRQAANANPAETIKDNG